MSAVSGLPQKPIRGFSSNVEELLRSNVGTMSVSSFGGGESALDVDFRPCVTGLAIHATLAGVAINRPRNALRSQWADQFFVNIQCQGSLCCVEGGRELHAQRGDVVIVDPRSESVISGSERASFIALPLPVAALAPTQRSGRSAIAQVIPGQEGIGKLLFETIHFLLGFGGTPDMATVRGARSMLLQLLQTAISEGAEGAAERECMILAKMRDWASAAIVSGALTVPNLAKTFAMSERSLYRFFARQGTTPDKFIWEQRMERARNVLETGSCSVTSAAFIAGFRNLSHFSRSFNRAYGCPPSKYRKGLNG